MAKTKVSGGKIKLVKELSDLIKGNRTIMIVSTKGLPSSQFQAIRKKIKDKAVIKVGKKNIIVKAIESIEKGALMNLKNYVKEDYAIIFSKIEPFELAAELTESKSPAKAKAGQKALENIEIEAGATDLPPGPAISELSSVGLKVTVEDGKIIIKQGKIVTRKDEAITNEVAAVLNKLDIKPFEIGFEPIAVYDSAEEKIYTNIKIDKKATLESLKSASVKARALAVSINYYTKETIGFLLARAASQGKVLDKIIKPIDNVQIENQNIQEEK